MRRTSLISFVEKLPKGGCHLLAAAVRAVLRFLVAEGALPPNLDRAIVGVVESGS